MNGGIERFFSARFSLDFLGKIVVKKNQPCSTYDLRKAYSNSVRSCYALSFFAVLPCKFCKKAAETVHRLPGRNSMIRTKTQGIVFGILMSYAMAYGMEVYNVAIKEGVDLAAGGFSNMTNIVFRDALIEALYMGVFVFIFSNLWGNRIGAAFAARHCDPEKDNPYICQLLRQAGTVAIMCPTMSLAASILFNVILAGAPLAQLPAI